LNFFQKFSEIFASQGAPPVSTTLVPKLPLVSLTPAANFATSSTCVVDTGLFRFISVFRTYIETTETNRTVSEQTVTNLNNPKFSEKYQNMLSIKLFRLVFCLFGSTEISKLSVSV
jgi:hypothetical protein